MLPLERMKMKSMKRMKGTKRAFTRATSALALLYVLLMAFTAAGQSQGSEGRELGREVGIPRHLQDGEEFTIPLGRLIQFGAQLFAAKFTIQEGAGRPLTKGTG